MANLDKLNGGFIGAPKFPHFIFFETLLYFYNKTEKEIYIQPVEKLLNSLCSEGIYDHVEGGVSRYTIDENGWFRILKRCFMIMYNLFP